MPLNVKTIESFKPKARPYKKADGNGLSLHIMPNGNKHWRWRYRFSGKEKMLSLGSYPYVSLIDARMATLNAKKTVKDGVDPSAKKQEAKRAELVISKNTFQAVAEDWHERKYADANKKHSDNIIRRLRKHVFPVIGHLAISKVQTKDIITVIRAIEDKGALEMARRALQNCGQVFHYAGQLQLVSHDPTSLLKKDFLKKRPTQHYKTIDVRELPNLVQKIRHNDARLFKQTRIALEMMMLTFVRTSELINARWSEFDFELKRWVIPAERMKMRREHTVPLARQVIALLDELQEISGKREYLFPSIPRPSKPMSNATLLRALERLGYHKMMTGHGFRALAATALQEKLNTDYRYVDRQLAHMRKGAVNQAYDRADFIDQRTTMMQDWADYIDKLI